MRARRHRGRGAGRRRSAALSAFGEEIGLAFQIADDVLDATATSAELGKTAGRDAALAKSTYVGLLGVEGARAEAERLAAERRGAPRALPAYRPTALGALARLYCDEEFVTPAVTPDRDHDPARPTIHGPADLKRLTPRPAARARRGGPRAPDRVRAP